MNANRPGVYTIVYVATGRAYVGASVWPARRWKHHRGALNHGTHCNAWLQRAWSKHGEAAFEFRMLTNCLRKNLQRRENEFIDRTKLRYNFTRATPGPRNPRTTWTEERRQQHSERMKGNTHLRGKKMGTETRVKLSRIRTGKTPRRSEAWRLKASRRMKMLNRQMNKNRPQNQKGYRDASSKRA